VIIVNCIEGLSASSRDEESTLSHLTRNVIRSYMVGHPGVTDIILHEVASGGKSAIDRSLIFIEQNTHSALVIPKLLLVGKSLGGVKTWWILKSHWAKLAKYKVYCLLVDPHGPIMGDDVVGSYKKGRNLSDKEAWHSYDTLRRECIYQQDHWPTGARWDGAENEKFPEGADHWNITEKGSEYSGLTKQKIRDGLDWLAGEEE